MAVLKHIAIKNADYSAAVCYLKYQHDERHLKPLLDENGSMMLRSEFHMNGVNCNPDTFDLECEMLNDQYRKNYRYDEVKSHHYIISFDPRDKDEHHLTGEKAQTLGLEFVKNHLPGHQALVCTHTDGHNGSGNIHVHIIINSLRKLDIEPQSYTTRSIDCKAGYKHHLTKDYLKYLQQELMNLCQRENLYQVDLLSPAQHKITEAEYWLQKRGQKELEDINEQIIADGMNPMETTFQTRKQFVRNAVSEISSSAISFEDFQSQLFEKYKIHVKENRGRYSYLHPEREKYISGRSLGTNFDKDYQFLAHKFRNQANRYHCKNSRADNYIGFFFSINADRLPGILNHPPDKIFFSAIDLFHIICFFVFCFCAIICLLSNDKAIIFLHQWF